MKKCEIIAKYGEAEYKRRLEKSKEWEKRHPNRKGYVKKNHVRLTKEELKANRRSFYSANKSRLVEISKEYYRRNRKRVKRNKREFRKNNKERLAKQAKKYREAHKKQISEYLTIWRNKNRARIKELNSQYLLTEKGRLRNAVHVAKRRRQLDYTLIMSLKNGEQGHHVTNEYVIGVPAKVHQSFSGSTRRKHRTLVLQWLKVNDKKKYKKVLSVLAQEPLNGL